MGIIEVFSKSLDLIVRDAKVVLLYAVLWIVAFVLGASFSLALAGTLLGTPDNIRSFTDALSIISLSSIAEVSASAVIFLIIFLFVYAIVSGAFANAVEQYRKKRGVDLALALKGSLSRIWSIIGAEILLAIIAFAPILVLSLIIVFPALALVSGVLRLLLLAFFVMLASLWVIVFSVISFQTIPAIMFENRKAFAAVKRSIHIGKSYSFDIFGVLVISLIISAILGFFLAVPILGIFVALFLGTWMLLVSPTFYYEYVAKNTGKKKSKK